MKTQNISALNKLAGFCKYVGLIFVFLGIVVGFIDFLNQDWIHMQVGFLIFMCGYTFVKIGAKIASVLFDERTEI